MLRLQLFRLMILLICIMSYCIDSAAQRKKISLKDSLDGAIDLSDYIIDAHGFVPVPVIITEPALGGFGFGLVPVFLQKNRPYIDSIGDSVKITPVAPNITGGIGLYTVNNSWAALAFRQGTLVKQHIKYASILKKNFFDKNSDLTKISINRKSTIASSQ